MKKYLTKLATGTSGAVMALQLTAGNAIAQVTETTVEPGKGFAKDIGKLINGLLTFVMVLAVLLVFLYLIMGGIEWITSGGDKQKTETARNKITAAVVGLVVLASSYAILLIVLNFLNFDDLTQVINSIGEINISE